MNPSLDVLLHTRLKRFLPDSGKPFSCREKTASPVFSHSHPHREIFVVLKGMYLLRYGSSAYRLSPGDVFTVQSGVGHEMSRIPEKTPFAHMWIYLLNDQLMGRVYLAQESGKDSADSDNGFQLISPSYLASEKLRGMMEEHWDMGADYLAGPICTLMEEMRWFCANGGQDSRRRCHDIVDSIQEYIRRNNGKECSLQRLEKVTGYSRHYLTHTFRKRCGCTIESFIDQVRLSRTEQMLSQGLRMKEIALELGFASSTSFWKWYRDGKPSY